MTTNHQIVFGNSNNMKEVEDESIDLVVTSPPYPMYDMWDVMFTNMNEEIGDSLETNPMRAFELQHRELDRVWDECIRVLKEIEAVKDRLQYQVTYEPLITTNQT